MWRFGFFLHEMAFGLLSILFPLYIIAVGGSLVDIGIMASVALFLSIPASFFWGYMCDKTRHYKRYILISFLSSAIILYFFTFTTSVGLLIILYVAMSILHAAHEAPKNVLIAELYTREDWEKTFALYEGFTETGWLIGLLLGFLMANCGISATPTLFLCSGLNLAAFIASLILVTDPLLIFERRLVSIEKTVSFAYNGMIIASKILDGFSLNEKLKKENVSIFCSGLVLFSLATSILFTPLPIFFYRGLAISASAVFAIYALNSCGGVVGYFLASRRLSIARGSSAVSRVVLFRGMLAFLFIAVTQMHAYNLLVATAILALMGFAYALFLVFTLSLSMELIPQGKSGLFNVLIGLGGAFGSFIGPFLADAFGFVWVFLTAGLMFLLAYVAFKVFT
jgi:MFS family permease